MARTKSFDPNTALRKAMKLFWRQGYSATSMDDLVHAMGINRASLYETFGDKRTLFLKALGLYIDAVLEPRLAALEASPSAFAGLRTMLSELIAFGCGDPQRRGCFAVNTACELGGDAEIAARLRAQRERVEARLTRLIARAQEDGEVAGERDPAAFARVVATLIDGLRVAAKLGAERTGLESIAATVLAALE